MAEPGVVKAIQAFSCPSCGGQVGLRAAGHSLTAVCSHCSTVIDVEDGNFKIVAKAEKATRKTLLEIGVRGKLKDIVWEVVGYVQKHDRTRVYYWDEYLLFNPYHGFRFLIQSSGHWSFGTVVKADVTSALVSQQVWYGDVNYKLFLRDRPKVAYVKGEFYWRVRAGDEARTEDFIAPPNMLSLEHGMGEITVTLCEYLSHDVVKDAFHPAGAMPSRDGVGANQPNPSNLRRIAEIGGIAFAVLLLLQALVYTGSSERIFRREADYTAAERGKVFALSGTSKFPDRSNVLVETYSPVENNWVELSYEFVNNTTGEVFVLRQPVEYYHGYDSDGSWTEGSHNASDYVSGLTPGEYSVVYDVDAGVFSNGMSTASIRTTVTRNVPSWGNFIWTLILIGLWPVASYMGYASFEKRRWENSDQASPWGGD